MQTRVGGSHVELANSGLATESSRPHHHGLPHILDRSNVRHRVVGQ
jgi:hypothetical protein